jgi:HK97 family phage portal protein
MAWYDFLRAEKANPGQQVISQYEGHSLSSKEDVWSYQKYYEGVEIINRAINMVVDDVAEIRVKVGDQTKGISVTKGIKRITVEKLLNVQPNPYQDINTFFRNLVLDYMIDGNIFVYYDGVHIYHLPAAKVTIHPDSISYVSGYSLDGRVEYSPEEIIHIKENSFESIYRGTSRLKACLRTMKLLKSMRDFQDNFFSNGAVPGLIIKSPNTLSDKVKERMSQSWAQKYNPKNGGRRPLILDGGMEVEDLTKLNFRDLDFQTSISANEDTVLKAIGVPPILLNSGNNANIRPNHRLYYLETIIPIVRKINFAFERFFGYTIVEDVANIPALQPELQEQGSFLTTLVNSGIITADEARNTLGFEPKGGEADELRIPANIAGSAVNPGTGGRPKE